MTWVERLHLNGIHCKVNLFLVNKIYCGTNAAFFERKRKLLNAIGYQIGEGTKVVAPIYCTGKLIVGKDCWLGKNLMVNGNGMVTIGDNCDIAPEVAFQTGGHIIGSAERRAGEGVINDIVVGDGTWIGARATIINNVTVGHSCVIASCACVTKNVENNTLVGGVPAKPIRALE